MVRSMYSGVAGMRTHQTSMDTIGNNIANVNTFGFKGSRVTFKDIYYQNMRGASAASTARGGVNPSQVGVGVQVGSVDAMMTRTSFTQTDMTMDIALDGEGFIQVMDADGNKYYTRAGQLNFDSAGNLVDSKGNFVLGTQGDPFGKAPGSSKIQVALGSVDPKASSVTETINGNEFTITTSNDTKDGNVGMQFMAVSNLADDVLVEADVTDSGVVVRVNANAEFTDINAFSTAVDAAIQKASNIALGKNHPAGTFTITSGIAFPDGKLTGEQLCSSAYGAKLGKVTTSTSMSTKAGTYSFPADGVGTAFMSDLKLASATQMGDSKFEVTCAADGTRTIKLTVDGAAGTATYEGKVDGTKTTSGKVRLKRTDGTGDDEDYIEVKYPALKQAEDPPASAAETLENLNSTGTWGTAADGTPTFGPNPINLTDLKATSTLPSNAQGLSSTTFLLTGGTEGGEQGIESLSGITIGTDGTIIGFHNELGQVKIGRIDLATFANPAGLEAQGGTYFLTSANSGTPTLTKAGENGSGQIVSGSLELSNVDLSREFTDMIKTQRGYQANSRIITVSDTMLEELVNLKR